LIASVLYIKNMHFLILFACVFLYRTGCFVQDFYVVDTCFYSVIGGFICICCMLCLFVVGDHVSAFLAFDSPAFALVQRQHNMFL